MGEVIVYNQPNGVLAVIHPNPDCGLTIAQIAAKDVPFGLPYKIIDSADVPTDRRWRNSWTADNSDLTDGVGADYGAGSSKIVVDWVDGRPVTKEISE